MEEQTHIVTIQVNSKEAALKLRNKLYASNILTEKEKSNLGFQAGAQE